MCVILLLGGFDVASRTKAQRVAKRYMVEAIDRLVSVNRDAERDDLAFGKRQIAFATTELACKGHGINATLVFAFGLDQRCAALVDALRSDVAVNLG